MSTDTASVEKGNPRDDRSLEVSYGKPIPQPKMKKGDFVAFGELAGSESAAPSVSGARTGTHFVESIDAAEKNL
jgi:hypothetical protein